MDIALLDRLVDPVNHVPLRLDPGENGRATGEVHKGTLRSSEDRSYPVRGGIPRFVNSSDERQLQTTRSFAYKWKQQHTYDSNALLNQHRRWVVEKYGFGNEKTMRDFFASRRNILDAGCGAGLSSSTWLDEEWAVSGNATWTGLDISTAVEVASERLGHLPRTHFVQGDVLATPFADGTFDTVFSEGVLHHTPSTEAAISELARVLSPGGQLLFYVYRKKGPIREFTDDYVRDVVSQLPEEEAWEALKPLTRLGQALSELGVEVEVPEDIPFLGIKAGRIDVQRLIYWNFGKMFWNPDYGFEENHHINFDWYHPKYAHRHTEAELREWCRNAALTITHLSEQESGYTIVATRN